MNSVVPITATTVDWKSYLLIGKQVMGHSISTILDTNGLTADSLRSFIITLGGLQDQKHNPSHIIAEAGNLLYHASFGFLLLIDTETLIELMELTAISVYSVPVNNHNRLAIASGTLLDWHTAVIACCSPTTSRELRGLFDTILLHFEKMGLGQVWTKYSKHSVPDKTFVLEAK